MNCEVKHKVSEKEANFGILEHLESAFVNPPSRQHNKKHSFAYGTTQYIASSAVSSYFEGLLRRAEHSIYPNDKQANINKVQN
jgi:hypothetical protein